MFPFLKQHKIYFVVYVWSSFQEHKLKYGTIVFYLKKLNDYETMRKNLPNEEKRKIAKTKRTNLRAMEDAYP